MPQEQLAFDLQTGAQVGSEPLVPVLSAHKPFAKLAIAKAYCKYGIFNRLQAALQLQAPTQALSVLQTMKELTTEYNNIAPQSHASSDFCHYPTRYLRKAQELSRCLADPAVAQDELVAVARAVLNLAFSRTLILQYNVDYIAPRSFAPEARPHQCAKNFCAEKNILALENFAIKTKQYDLAFLLCLISEEYLYVLTLKHQQTSKTHAHVHRQVLLTLMIQAMQRLCQAAEDNLEAVQDCNIESLVTDAKQCVQEVRGDIYCFTIKGLEWINSSAFKETQCLLRKQALSNRAPDLEQREQVSKYMAQLSGTLQAVSSQAQPSAHYPERMFLCGKQAVACIALSAYIKAGTIGLSTKAKANSASTSPDERAKYKQAIDHWAQLIKCGLPTGAGILGPNIQDAPHETSLSQAVAAVPVILHREQFKKTNPNALSGHGGAPAAEPHTASELSPHISAQMPKRRKQKKATDTQAPKRRKRKNASSAIHVLPLVHMANQQPYAGDGAWVMQPLSSQLELSDMQLYSSLTSCAYARSTYTSVPVAAKSGLQPSVEGFVRMTPGGSRPTGHVQDTTVLDLSMKCNTQEQCNSVN